MKAVSSVSWNSLSTRLQVRPSGPVLWASAYGLPVNIATTNSFTQFLLELWGCTFDLISWPLRLDLDHLSLRKIKYSVLFIMCFVSAFIKLELSTACWTGEKTFPNHRTMAQALNTFYIENQTLLSSPNVLCIIHVTLSLVSLNLSSWESVALHRVSNTNFIDWKDYI